MSGYLPARGVLVKAYAGTGVPALLGVCQRAVGVAGEVDAQRYEIVDYLLRTAYHSVYRGGVVFVVPGAHGVVEIAVVVGVGGQAADAALGEVAVGLVGRVLADDEHLLFGREIERTVEPGNARPHYYNIVFFIEFYH